MICCHQEKARMTRLGGMYGPDATFLGVDRADLDDPASWASADIMFIGAPFDGGTSHRPGARFGPLAELKVVDAGDVEMPSGDTELSLQRLEDAVHRASAGGAITVILGGDHTIAL